MVVKKERVFDTQGPAILLARDCEAYDLNNVTDTGAPKEIDKKDKRSKNICMEESPVGHQAVPHEKRATSLIQLLVHTPSRVRLARLRSASKHLIKSSSLI